MCMGGVISLEYPTRLYSLKADIECCSHIASVIWNFVYARHQGSVAICLQESWLLENEDILQIKLEHYSCIAQNNSCTSKGRLIIYLNNKYKYVAR